MNRDDADMQNQQSSWTLDLEPYNSLNQKQKLESLKPKSHQPVVHLILDSMRPKRQDKIPATSLECRVEVKVW